MDITGIGKDWDGSVCNGMDGNGLEWIRIDWDEFGSIVMDWDGLG